MARKECSKEPGEFNKRLADALRAMEDQVKEADGRRRDIDQVDVDLHKQASGDMDTLFEEPDKELFSPRCSRRVTDAGSRRSTKRGTRASTVGRTTAGRTTAGTSSGFSSETFCDLSSPGVTSSRQISGTLEGIPDAGVDFSEELTSPRLRRTSNSFSRRGSMSEAAVAKSIRMEASRRGGNSEEAGANIVRMNQAGRSFTTESGFSTCDDNLSVEDSVGWTKESLPSTVDLSRSDTIPGVEGWTFGNDIVTGENQSLSLARFSVTDRSGEAVTGGENCAILATRADEYDSPPYSSVYGSIYGSERDSPRHLPAVNATAEITMVPVQMSPHPPSPSSPKRTGRHHQAHRTLRSEFRTE